jgi:methylmalonyl-CoA mutase, N-terminal domain
MEDSYSAWWEKYTKCKVDNRLYTNLSGIPLQPLYTPKDLENFSYQTHLGFPGEYPFTRGIYTTMYRGRLWTFRQFAGFGTPKDTNKRFKYLLSQGQTGLSIAFDMPTLMGYDADDKLAKGEVGKEGVNVCTLQDMIDIFDGIEMEKVSTSMTINATALIVWAFYIVAAKLQGADLKKISGTIQNDMLKEFQAQKEWIIPVRPSVKLVVDSIEFSAQHLPKWHPVSISGYHIREAGSTAVQELAFTLGNGFCYVEETIKRGVDVDTFAPHLSFFFNSHINFFEEIAKFRAARRIWAKTLKEKFNAKKPESLMLRFHTQTAGVSLTAQQPHNNIIRTTLEALAAVLGGTQSLHTNSMDEAWALPTEEAVKIALRTQQIIAYESGVADVIDPLGGSYYVEALTNKMEEEANKYFKEIEKLGGMIPATEKGYIQKEIAHSAYQFQKELEEKKRFIVGVNIFVEDKKENIPILKIDEKYEEEQVKRVKNFKLQRNFNLVKKSLERLRQDIKENRNVMPAILECVENKVTLGEISTLLKEEYGTYREATNLW